jgi:mannose/fructose-specific phosphotransferase system component IIA
MNVGCDFLRSEEWILGAINSVRCVCAVAEKEENDTRKNAKRNQMKRKNDKDGILIRITTPVSGATK